MAGFEILKVKQIKEPDTNVISKLDKNVSVSIDQLSKKVGQYKSITVCEHKNSYLIVDGAKHFKELKKLGLKKVLCYNLGQLTTTEYLAHRLRLNIHQSRIDYIGVAEIIQLMSKDERLTSISNKTGIDLVSVEKYAKLLDFDWDDFNKKQINKQINPFDYE